MNWISKCVALVMLMLGCCEVNAQQAVVTQPGAALSVDASGTIAVTNTFQQIWPNTSNTPGNGGTSGQRKGCLIANTSTDRQWVYFGPLASATKASAIPLEPASSVSALGGYVSCATGSGSTLQDQVSITGTANDTFVAKQQ